jgi:hypothetical protein
MEFALSESQAVECLAGRRLTEDCSYAFYFRDITCEYDSGTLTVRGRVPTYYLKQIITSRLREMREVSCLQNDVDVVSADGLSSLHAL